MISNPTRSLQISSAVSIIFLLLTSIVSVTSIRQLISNTEEIDRSFNFVGQLNTIMSSLKDSETGLRGYLLSHDESFLEPYLQTNKRIPSLVAQTQTRDFSSERQKAKFKELSALVEMKHAVMEELVRAHQQKLPLNLALLEKGKTLMDQARSLAAVMEKEEQHLLDIGYREQARFFKVSPIFISVACLLALALSILYHIKITREITERVRLENQLIEHENLTQLRIQTINNLTRKISSGDYTVRIDHQELDTLGELSHSLNLLAEQLQSSFNKILTNEWIQSGIVQVSAALVGEKSHAELGSEVLKCIMSRTQSEFAAFYRLEENKLHLVSSYGATDPAPVVELGSGILGSAANENHELWLRELPAGQMSIRHGMGHISPANLLIIPIRFENQVIGMIELAAVHHYADRDLEFLKAISGNIGSAVRRVENRLQIHRLLNETINQSDELQVQTEELQSQTENLFALNDELQQQKALEIKTRNEAELAKTIAENASKATAAFLAVMSHEIRTPLNGLIGMASLLSGTKLSEEQEEYVNIIMSSGNGLITLINDIMDFSKIDTRNMTMEQVEFDLRACIEDVIDLFAAQAAAKKLALLYDIDPKVPNIIIGDSYRCRQVLLNLISNALKFTAKGEILIQVFLTSATDKGMNIQFNISDSGIGIPEEKLSDLFKPFTQLDSSNTRKYGGTGLGLTISKKLVELMGGELKVESIAGAGTTFFFSIFSPPYTGEVATTLVLPAELHGRQVLLIEKNTKASSIMERQLQHLNLRVTIVRSGQAALEHLQQESQPDFIITGFDLADMDALQFKGGIRAMSLHIPVVLLSNIGDGISTEAQKTEFELILRSPLKPGNLHKGILKLLGPQQKEPATSNRTAEQPKPEAHQPASTLQILLAEDNLINQKLAIKILEKMGYQADIANNGQEALRMCEQKNYDIILIDILMPELDGLDACRRIRQCFKHQPSIIAMTASVTPDDRDACFKAGMDAFLAKPVKPAELADAINQVLASA